MYYKIWFLVIPNDCDCLLFNFRTKVLYSEIERINYVFVSINKHRSFNFVEISMTQNSKCGAIYLSSFISNHTASWSGANLDIVDLTIPFLCHTDSENVKIFHEQ